jgi:hypothetical protein
MGLLFGTDELLEFVNHIYTIEYLKWNALRRSIIYVMATVTDKSIKGNTHYDECAILNVYRCIKK